MTRLFGPEELFSPDALAAAAAVSAEVLAAGGLVGFPTETVYGLGADSSSADAVAGIFDAKGRPRGHPLIVHMASAADLTRFGADVPPLAEKLAAAFWPGPLTIIVGRADTVAAETAGGLDTVGLRVPDHPVALALLRAFGGGVAAPSANRFGSVSPTRAQHVISELGPLVDVVLDGGPSAVGVESTIVDVSGPTPTLLRPGGISSVELEAVCGTPVTDGRTGRSRAPGMLASHYAPDVTVELVTATEAGARLEAEDGSSSRDVGPTGLIAPFASDHDPSWRLSPEAGAYASRLYETLRAADRAGLGHLLVVPPETGPLLDAVLDRLSKAAAPRPDRSGDRPAPDPTLT